MSHHFLASLPRRMVGTPLGLGRSSSPSSTSLANTFDVMHPLSAQAAMVVGVNSLAAMYDQHRLG